MLRPSLAFALVTLYFSPLSANAFPDSISHVETHSDSRNSPKFLIVTNQSHHLESEADLDLVESYLKKEAHKYGISKDLSNIQLVGIRKSLIGSHYRFQQVENQIPVAKGEILVNLDKTGKSIRTIYNNIFPYKKQTMLSTEIISESEAYDAAWNALRVHAPIIEDPSITLEYHPIKQNLQLVYNIKLSVQKPYGAWQILVNGHNGKIVSIRDIRFTRREKRPIDFDKYKGKVLDRKIAFEAYRKRQQKREIFKYQVDATADLETKIFDPDPRTSLNNPDLEDDSSADLFEDAYLHRILREINFDGEAYSLKGPWVQIIDYDPPNTAPHQHHEATWNFTRGQYPFNEAMTYFHVDASQRYIQSLGFSGDLGIQHTSIEVDADGANGDDNSYFQPSSNRMSFGHGCVDDNEDADVILHEYGHAIQDDINPNWTGGDTGAMGEGFGDYWAGSYSISTESGSEYFPNQVFSWDGHGTANSCWTGRILNALDAQYDHSKNYAAHVGIDGGYQSDELWSTPLFQTLLDLMDQGIPREQVDRIILQSHFGLGADLKMRDLAQNTVLVARELYPEGPHADTFKKHFIRHGIINSPAVKFKLEEISIEEENDSYFDPGDILELHFTLANIGNLDASQVELKLSSDNHLVEIIGANLSFGDLKQGQRKASSGKIQVLLNQDLSCGESINLIFDINAGKTHFSQTLRHEIRTGEALGVNYESKPMTSIPDNDESGIIDAITIAGKQYKVSRHLKVHIQIEHRYRGDLSLELSSPDNRTMTLLFRKGNSADDIRGTFPDTLTPDDNLSTFLGDPLTGDWQLKVVDHAQADAGILESWGIEDIVGYKCRNKKGSQ